jgi:hypothetical protein
MKHLYQRIIASHTNVINWSLKKGEMQKEKDEAKKERKGKKSLKRERG